MHISYFELKLSTRFPLSLSSFLSFPLSPKPFPPLSRSSSHHFTKFRIKHVICCWCWIRSSMFFFRRDYCKISLERTCYQGWEKKCIKIEWKEMDKIEAKTIPIQGYCWRQNTRWWSMIYCHLYGTSNFQWNINSKHIVQLQTRAHAVGQFWVAFRSVHTDEGCYSMALYKWKLCLRLNKLHLAIDMAKLCVFYCCPFALAHIRDCNFSICSHFSLEHWFISIFTQKRCSNLMYFVASES